MSFENRILLYWILTWIGIFIISNIQLPQWITNHLGLAWIVGIFIIYLTWRIEELSELDYELEQIKKPGIQIPGS